MFPRQRSIRPQFDLNLNSREFMIQFSGRRGAQVANIRSKLEIISDFAPDIVILQIGSYDLCSAVKAVDPQAMASKVADDIFHNGGGYYYTVQSAKSCHHMK